MKPEPAMLRTDVVLITLGYRGAIEVPRSQSVSGVREALNFSLSEDRCKLDIAKRPDA